jgi:hypothetical protein
MVLVIIAVILHEQFLSELSNKWPIWTSYVVVETNEAVSEAEVCSFIGSFSL